MFLPEDAYNRRTIVPEHNLKYVEVPLNASMIYGISALDTCTIRCHPFDDRLTLWYHVQGEQGGSAFGSLPVAVSPTATTMHLFGEPHLPLVHLARGIWQVYETVRLATGWTGRINVTGVPDRVPWDLRPRDDYERE